MKLEWIITEASNPNLAVVSMDNRTGFATHMQAESALISLVLNGRTKVGEVYSITARVVDDGGGRE